MRIWPALSARFSDGPAEIAGQQFLRVEDQIAAIGAVQRARHQQVEIGDEGAEAGEMLDPADQGLMGRVVLVDDRRAVLAAIVDETVDPVAAEARVVDAPRPRPPGPAAVRSRRWPGRGNRRRFP